MRATSSALGNLVLISFVFASLVVAGTLPAFAASPAVSPASPAVEPCDPAAAPGAPAVAGLAAAPLFPLVAGSETTLVSTDRKEGPAPEADCSASCGGGTSVTCWGTSCQGVDRNCPSTPGYCWSSNTGYKYCPRACPSTCSAWASCSGGGSVSCSGTTGDCFGIDGCYAHCDGQYHLCPNPTPPCPF